MDNAIHKLLLLRMFYIFKVFKDDFLKNASITNLFTGSSPFRLLLPPTQAILPTHQRVSKRKTRWSSVVFSVSRAISLVYNAIDIHSNNNAYYIWESPCPSAPVLQFSDEGNSCLNCCRTVLCSHLWVGIGLSGVGEDTYPHHKSEIAPTSPSTFKMVKYNHIVKKNWEIFVKIGCKVIYWEKCEYLIIYCMRET
jgi:hypothetical protein